MGFLDNLFQTQEKNLHNDWKVLTTKEQLDQIVDDSFHKPVVIFKHSIQCGISSMVKFHMEDQWDFDSKDLDFYYLDLINKRPISNLIAERFGVVHQSPQILVFKDGEVIYHTSHHMVSLEAIHEVLNL